PPRPRGDRPPGWPLEGFAPRRDEPLGLEAIERRIDRTHGDLPAGLILDLASNGDGVRLALHARDGEHHLLLEAAQRRSVALDPFPAHCSRRVIAGSTRAARSAGIIEALIPTPTRFPTASRVAVGWPADTP